MKVTLLEKIEANRKEIALVKERLRILSDEYEILRLRLKSQKPEIKASRLRRQKSNNHVSRSSASLHCSRWDEVDEIYILKNRVTMTAAQMAARLGRTIVSVRNRVYVLRMQGLMGGEEWVQTK